VFDHGCIAFFVHRAGDEQTEVIPMRSTTLSRGSSIPRRQIPETKPTTAHAAFFAMTVFVVMAFLPTASFGQAETVLWSENWEGNWIQDWHVDAGTWEVGAPSSGPGDAYDSLMCAATILAGNYPDGVNTRLVRHTTFVVPPASENPRLRIWHWYSFFCNDYGEVQIRTVSGGDWTTISETYAWPSSCGNWSRVFVDLSAWADSTVQVAFHFYSENVYSSWCNWENEDVSSGWYIDDVKVVTGPRVFNSPEDWESGIDDWYADFGVWEVGVPTSGPDSAYVGDRCATTILDGNYCDDLSSRLMSPSFVVPDAARNPAVGFWHWYSFSTNDYGEVQIQVGDEPWVPLSRYSGTGGGVWSPVYIDFAAYANSTVRIAFYFHSGGPNTSVGWYIDDIVIYGLVPTLLKSYFTKTGESWIELRWRLSEVGRGVQHRISRESLADGTTTEFVLDHGVENRLSYEYRDGTVEPGKTYRYRVSVIDEDGSHLLFVTDEITSTAIESALHQNHPNPFNPVTNISYVVGNTELVDLKVYDTRGALVKTLHHSVQAPGRYEAVWDGHNNNGHRVASGIYFYRATIGKFTQTRKMVLLK
jgi:hypothetical protein